MASNPQQQFIDNLANFSNALESIVNILEEQSKVNPTDVVNQLLENLDGQKISKLVENVEKIQSDTKNINKKIDNVLQMQKDTKKQKEAGLFGKIAEDDNKNKIIDGIKVVTLIAGGVLAIGTAFKIVGNVDFGSVVALSFAILTITTAFVSIKESKLTVKDALMTSIILTTLSGSLLLSNLILKYIDPLTPYQLLTIGGMTIALGISLYGITKALKNVELNSKTIAGLLLLPVIVPVTAFAILTASKILSGVQPLDPKTILSTIAVSLIIGLSTFILVKAMENMKLSGGQIAGLLLLPVIVPLISYSIVISSQILKNVEPFTLSEVFNIAITALGVSISLLAFAPAVWILSKIGKNISALAQGALATVIVSTALMISSLIIGLGNYDKYPSLEWSAGVGLSLLAFGLSTLALGTAIMLTGGIGAAAIALGALATIGISGAIVASSKILSQGTYGNYPSVEWASGVGLSLLAFASSMAVIGLIEGVSKLFGGGMDFGQFVIDASKSMVIASSIISQGNWGSNYPTKEWADGVGGSILMFAKSFAAISLIEGISKLFGGGMDFSEFVLKASTSMLLANTILSGGNWNTGFPKKEWADGVGGSIVAFTEAFKNLDDLDIDIEDFSTYIMYLSSGMISIGKSLSENQDAFNFYPSDNWNNSIKNFLSIIPDKSEIKNLDKMVDVFKEFGSINNKTFSNIDRLSESINNLSRSLSNLVSTDIDKLVGLTGSILTMSIIDQKELENVIDTINDKTKDLKKVSDGSSGFLEKIINFDKVSKSAGVESAGNLENNIETIQSVSSNNNGMGDLIGYVKNIDYNLQSIVDTSKSEKETEGENSPSKGEKVN